MLSKLFGNRLRVSELAALAAAMCLSAEANDSQRRFTVSDSVELNYFGTMDSSQPDDLDDDGLLSPNGKYIIKLTHRGVLSQGNMEGTIWLFDADAVRRGLRDKLVDLPKPVSVAHVAGPINASFIPSLVSTVSHPSWALDSRSVVFLAGNGQMNRQIFRVDLETHDVTALTPADQNVIDYTLSKGGLVYLAGAPLHEDQIWWSTGPGIPDITNANGKALIHLLYPNFHDDAFSLPAEFELWRLVNDRATPVIDATTKAPVQLVTKYTTETLSLSSDGTRLATIAYSRPPPLGEVRRDARAQSDRTLQYRVIDLVHGTSVAALDAPIEAYEWNKTGRYRVAWSVNDSELVLSQAEAPTSVAKTSTKSHYCTVVIVNLGTRASNCLDISTPSNGYLYSLEWVPAKRQIVVRYRKHGEYQYSDVLIENRGNQWRVAKPPTPWTYLSIQLTVREGVNDPPVLMANDPAFGARPLFDPNSQLAKIALGTVVPYQWQARGQTIRGGLVRPPDFATDKRYPLVVQTHGFDLNRFYAYGYSQTSNAGRALAARDILVLQVNEPTAKSDDEWREGNGLATEAYIAAVDQLVSEGLVDSQKVGISGYSFSGFLVSKAITKAPDRFAAAAISNTDPGSLGSYFTYLNYGGAEYINFAARVMAGAKPYGAGLKKWLENAPGFSTDKILAPVILLPSTPQDLISSWPLYASLEEQNKPVDLEYTRGGEHNLRNPLEILAHQELLVDWFDFWLNAHEDPNPTKSEQYARWRALRSLRERELATLASPSKGP